MLLGVQRRALSALKQQYGVRSFAVSPFAQRRTLPVNYGVRVVPQQEQWVVERFGRFHRVLDAGIHFLIPIVDRISYVHSVKEVAFDIPNQTAITQDNVVIHIDGVVFIKVRDAIRASYEVQDPFYAISQLAQTTMRSEIGKLSLDKTFEEREHLNVNIVRAIQKTAEGWGMDILRYEIRDINVPSAVRQAMDLQAEAERKKRKQILESEGEQRSAINVAEGQKAAIVLKSEAFRMEQINYAEGEANAIVARARAIAEGVHMIAESLRTPEGKEAVAVRLAEQYIESFGRLAKQSNTIVIPADASNVSSLVAQGMSIFDSLRRNSPVPVLSHAEALAHATKQARIPAPPSSPSSASSPSVSNAGDSGVDK